MTISLKSAVLTAGFAFGAAAVNAATVTVDFTDDASYTSFAATGATGDIGTTQSWTATSTPADQLTRTGYDGSGTNPFEDNPLSFDDYDGLGVVDDEATFPDEMITVKFSTKLQVTGLYFLDLFGDEDDPFSEGVSIFLDGSATAFASYGSGGGDTPFDIGTFPLDDDGPNEEGGYAFIDLSKIDVSVGSISFAANAPNDGAGAPDFALAGIDFFSSDGNEPNPVPLPAGGVLLLTALGGLGLARRRKARKAV